jgi:hypothetical protein
LKRILKDDQIKKNKKDGYPVKELLVKNKRVVCFETKNGTLITRNSGKISIHGNCKNASHLIRLLRMGIEYLEEGELQIYRTYDAELLKEIKRGKWTLEQVKQEADRLFKEAERAFKTSKLPEKPDYQRAERLVMKVLGEYIFLKETLGKEQGANYHEGF